MSNSGLDDDAGFRLGGFDADRLARFVRDLDETMREIARLLAVHHPDRTIQPHFLNMEDAIRQRSSVLVDALSGLLNDTQIQHLVAHGLEPGPELDFKLAGFDRANSAFRSTVGLPTEAPPRLPDRRPRWRRFTGAVKDLVKHGAIRKAFIPAARVALAWGNIILGSIGEALPGAAAMKEIKEGLEAALGEV